ncbi:MAG TPA: 3-oxoacyl-ACP reductase family protein [bacterium]|nr:3-oxoacyl-ACP reductase family protein [bacterium]
MRFKDRVALVTGGSRGIGRAIALQFIREGATVYVNYLKNKAMAEEICAEAEKLSGTCYLVPGDVKSEYDANKIVDEVTDKSGRIDILVNNAGVTRDTLLMSMERSDWDEVVDTNLGSIFNFTRAAARYMMMEKRGRIVNISSFSGNRGGKGQANYAASKAAVNAFTRAVALELAPKGITVNAVAPGMIVTDMSSAVRGLASDTILGKIPLGRYGSAEEVAKLVAFLASDDAAYITGEVIAIDGGMSGAV